MMRTLVSNPWTTWSGLITLVVTLGWVTLSLLGKTDWTPEQIIGLAVSIGLLRARQDNVTSEESEANAAARVRAAKKLVPMLAMGMIVVTLPACAVGPQLKGPVGSATNSPLDALDLDYANDQYRIDSSRPTTSISADGEGFDKIATGVPTRDVTIRTPAGYAANLSSGSDIEFAADKLKVIDIATGKVLIDGAGLSFSTVTSEPTRAGNEALDRLQTVWEQLSADQRAAIEQQLEAIDSIASGVGARIIELIATGG